ncbi:MAG: histidine triad nucleotide-binding protein [Oscillospiraceae bacterium]|nr:histidine triad nucleotide-binding protein [Oscillospiraceae bacterium]
MENCLFCKLAAGEIPSTKVYEDETVYAFRDIAPQAPVHILVIPRTHIASVQELNGETIGLAAACLLAIPKIAAQEGLLPGGYRVVSNCGPDAGQTVGHLHFHILGGTRLNDRMA